MRWKDAVRGVVPEQAEAKGSVRLPGLEGYSLSGLQENNNQNSRGLGDRAGAKAGMGVRVPHTVTRTFTQNVTDDRAFTQQFA